MAKKNPFHFFLSIHPASPLLSPWEVRFYKGRNQNVNGQIPPTQESELQALWPLHPKRSGSEARRMVDPLSGSHPSFTLQLLGPWNQFLTILEHFCISPRFNLWPFQTKELREGLHAHTPLANLGSGGTWDSPKTSTKRRLRMVGRADDSHHLPQRN